VTQQDGPEFYNKAGSRPTKSPLAAFMIVGWLVAGLLLLLSLIVVWGILLFKLVEWGVGL